jgi:transcriptional regulator with XRE-family HTH domain
MPRPGQRHPATVALGERIRARRAELGLTQQALATKAEMDWSYCASVERGERNVTILNVLRLAEALDIDVGTLMSGLTLNGAQEPG